MQMYAHFGGGRVSLMIAALFGLVIFLDLKICSITLIPIICKVLFIPGGCLGFLPSTVGFYLLSLYCSMLGQYNDAIFPDADVFRV